MRLPINHTTLPHFQRTVPHYLATTSRSDAQSSQYFHGANSDPSVFNGLRNAEDFPRTLRSQDPGRQPGVRGQARVTRVGSQARVTEVRGQDPERGRPSSSGRPSIGNGRPVSGIPLQSQNQVVPPLPYLHNNIRDVQPEPITETSRNVESVDTEMHEFEEDVHPTTSESRLPPPPPPDDTTWESGLWRHLYPDVPDGEVLGYALLRILTEGMSGTRDTLRNQFAYHAKHFHHLSGTKAFPSTFERAIALITSGEPRKSEIIFYEVCANKCNYMFPLIPVRDKMNHCLFSHTACVLCECPTCGVRRFKVWKEGKKIGRIKPLAGGLYLGLERAFLDIQSAPGYLEKRNLFLGSRKRFSDKPDRARDMRWHSSPNYYKLLEHFNIASERDPKREAHTFYVGFWDGLSVARVTLDYSISAFVVHVEDLYMRQIGFGPFSAPVLFTKGPNKEGATDAHLTLFYQDVRKAAYQGFQSMPDQRFVLSGLHFDRPACQDILGVRGHNNLIGCGYCFGGTGWICNYTRYYGYDADATTALILKHEPPKNVTPIRPVTMVEFTDEARKAEEGDRNALLHRSPAILDAAPWLDVVESATFPIGHILGHAVSKKFLNQFSGTASRAPYLKIPANLRQMLDTLLTRVELPHDAGRGGEVFTTHRGHMTITDNITCVTMYLPLIFSIAFKTSGLTEDQHTRLDFLVYELEYLCVAVRWYYYGWAPRTDDEGNPLISFESKTYFAQKMASFYAVMVETTGFLKALTYGLHAMVMHMTKQELERGSLACCNELWGERALKVVAGIAKGRESSSNVELTIHYHMSMKRRLMALEQELQVRGLLVGGKSLSGLDVSSLNACRTVIKLLNQLTRFPILPIVALQHLNTVSDVDDTTVFYASALLAHGEVVHAETYTRLVSRTSSNIMYQLDDGEKAYGSVFLFYDRGVARALVAPLLVETSRCYGCVVELRRDESVCLEVPASTIVCKIMVMRDPDDVLLLHATECLHLRVPEGY